MLKYSDGRVFRVRACSGGSRDIAESCLVAGAGCDCWGNVLGNLPSLKPFWCHAWVSRRHAHSLPHLEGQEQLKSPDFMRTLRSSSWWAPVGFFSWFGRIKISQCSQSPSAISRNASSFLFTEWEVGGSLHTAVKVLADWFYFHWSVKYAAVWETILWPSKHWLGKTSKPTRNILFLKHKDSNSFSLSSKGCHWKLLWNLTTCKNWGQGGGCEKGSGGLQEAGWLIFCGCSSRVGF